MCMCVLVAVSAQVSSSVCACSTVGCWACRCPTWCWTRLTACWTWASSPRSRRLCAPIPAQRQTLFFSATWPARGQGHRLAVRHQPHGARPAALPYHMSSLPLSPAHHRHACSPSLHDVHMLLVSHRLEAVACPALVSLQNPCMTCMGGACARRCTCLWAAWRRSWWQTRAITQFVDVMGPYDDKMTKPAARS